MTRVVVNESGMQSLFRSESGATGRYLARKAHEVNTRAVQRARHRSNAMLQSLRFAGIFAGGVGRTGEPQMYALVGTDERAKHPGGQNFPYPRALELGVGARASSRGYPAPRTQPNQSYRYPFLEPSLCEVFGKPYSAV